MLESHTYCVIAINNLTLNHWQFLLPKAIIYWNYKWPRTCKCVPIILILYLYQFYLCYLIYFAGAKNPIFVPSNLTQIKPYISQTPSDIQRKTIFVPVRCCYEVIYLEVISTILLTLIQSWLINHPYEQSFIRPLVWRYKWCHGYSVSCTCWPLLKTVFINS